MEDASDAGPVTQPLLGEIGIFSYQHVPDGWAACNGQPLPIQQYKALFSLIGTQFGGDGTSTFALPDLRGTMIVHNGELQNGKTGGEERHLLSIDEIPEHTHTLQASDSGGQSSPKGTILGTSLNEMYGLGMPSIDFNENANSTSGGNQGHNNMQPSLVLNYCIAIAGLS